MKTQTDLPQTDLPQTGFVNCSLCIVKAFDISFILIAQYEEVVGNSSYVRNEVKEQSLATLL